MFHKFSIHGDRGIGAIKSIGYEAHNEAPNKAKN
jgi:hypothetical protein